MAINGLSFKPQANSPVTIYIITEYIYISQHKFLWCKNYRNDLMSDSLWPINCPIQRNINGTSYNGLEPPKSIENLHGVYRFFFYKSQEHFFLQIQDFSFPNPQENNTLVQEIFNSKYTYINLNSREIFQVYILNILTSL